MNAAPIRLVLIDDHVLVRAGLRSVLANIPDLEIVGEAGSGDEALALVERVQPDVVLMDLDTPRIGDIDATSALTAGQKHPAVLVLTMHGENEYLLEALRAGAIGYLTKSAGPQELVAAIRAAAAGEVYVRPDTGTLLATAFRHPTHAPVDERRRQYDGLSHREQAVLRLVAQGHTGPEIGEMLGVTAKTIDTYRHRIQEKIGLSHRKDYIQFALALGFLKT